MPNRRQAIIWTNDGPLYWRIFASVDVNELRKKCATECIYWWQFGIEFKKRMCGFSPRNNIYYKNVLWFDCVINTLSPGQNGHYFTDIFKCFFLKENVWISIKISRKFVPKGPINNIPALVQMMAWRRPGDKPLPEPMVLQFTDAYMRHSTSIS